ncbi:hypothetical protein LIER_30712 [Lithospermum erythrorhizon]|uniref:Uncharacterized protein n=1 Tax=Lithospermum erythrorhizon TaxID=34254 RepID=A0AAV3RSM4_LITER
MVTMRLATPNGLTASLVNPTKGVATGRICVRLILKINLFLLLVILKAREGVAPREIYPRVSAVRRPDLVQGTLPFWFGTPSESSSIGSLMCPLSSFFDSILDQDVLICILIEFFQAHGLFLQKRLLEFAHPQPLNIGYDGYLLVSPGTRLNFVWNRSWKDEIVSFSLWLIVSSLSLQLLQDWMEKLCSTPCCMVGGTTSGTEFQQCVSGSQEKMVESFIPTGMVALLITG